MKYTNAKDVGFYQIINYENGIKILFFSYCSEKYSFDVYLRW